MTKKKKKKSKPANVSKPVKLSKPSLTPRPEYRDNIELEDRRAVAITVAWMLATLSATVASVSWMIAAGITWYLKPPGRSSPIAMIPNTLWFVAFVAGLLCLGLMPAAYRWRSVPPPRAIAIYSGCIGVLPLVGLVVAQIVERLLN